MVKSKKRRKKRSKEFMHLIIFINVIVFFYIVKAIPSFLYPKISSFLGSISFLLMGSSRKLVCGNLLIAFGETLSLKERKRITRDLFSGIIMSFCEIIQMTKTSDEDIVKMAEFEGEDKLRQALSQGKGVVGVCSHMGNFPLLETVLVKKGYTANVIVRDPSARYLSKFCKTVASRRDVPYISKNDLKKTVKEAQDWISETRGILSFYLDQHAKNGVKTRFFGKNIFVPTGAAIFAKKYGCPVLGLFTYRMKNGRHKIIIEGPYPLQKTSNANEDIRHNTEYFMKRVEHYVKIAPEQWFSWLHKRFR